jgi:nitrate reductase gamma subunit
LAAEMTTVIAATATIMGVSFLKAYRCFRSLIEKEIFAVDKINLSLLMLCFCLIVGLEAASYAGITNRPPIKKEEQTRLMKEHMDKVKIKNPPNLSL